MDCLYISIDSELARQRAVEDNFARVAHANWTLARISAVDARQVESARAAGTLRPAEKGCFLSHIKAIERCRNHSGHTLIVEDDVLFGEKTFASIEAAINSIPDQNWDILFTDVCVPSLQTMMQMYFLQRTLNPGQLSLLKLDSAMPVGGSTAYVVNRRSTEKILSALRGGTVLDVPYDLSLQRLFNQSLLSGYVVFPFLTSLSEFADASQIQISSASQVSDLAWNAFRRLIWAERSLQTVTKTLDRIPAGAVDAESQEFSRIIACLLSANYIEKS